MPAVRDQQPAESLQGERVAFVGRLAGMSKREAQRLVRSHAAATVDVPDADVTLLVIGEENPPSDLAAAVENLDEAVRQAAERGTLKVVTETQLWQRMGMVEEEHEVRRLYTPAMLAELLGVPVSVVRRWHRKGLIVATREVHRLPYFDFQEVTTARRLAELLHGGCSLRTIEKKLAELAQMLPDVERPLAQMSVMVEGKQLLLRKGSGLAEPGGQLRIDFDSVDEDDASGAGDDAARESFGKDDPIVPFAGSSEVLDPATPEEMMAAATELEAEGQLEAAANMYRATLAAAGPNAEVSFLLAELLYRVGDLAAARERYYAAIELDENYVEARANLGCVLSETGEHELAIAAFEGALAFHGDYPDVHYHLARTLDQTDRSEEAEMHWRAFLAHAPDSPWAEEARDRLSGPDG